MKLYHLIFCFFMCQSALANPSWQKFKLEYLNKSKYSTFWSSLQKQALIMDFIHLNKPQIIVEIGTFQGAMTFAMTHALMFNQKGMLHTIDVWKYDINPDKQDYYNLFANFWYKQTWDGDKIYTDFLAEHFSNNMRLFCHPIRMDSLKAAAIFPDASIDMIYLDGDLRQEQGMQELIAFMPKIKKNGAIWLNRADLESKHEILAYLMQQHHYEKTWSYGNECVLFLK